jgi:hypothetical protein
MAESAAGEAQTFAIPLDRERRTSQSGCSNRKTKLIAGNHVWMHTGEPKTSHPPG